LRHLRCRDASGIDQALMGKAGCWPEIPGQTITKFTCIHQSNAIASFLPSGYAEVTIDSLPITLKRMLPKKQIKTAPVRQCAVLEIALAVAGVSALALQFEPTIGAAQRPLATALQRFWAVAAPT
jgi:hypothetical protein